MTKEIHDPDAELRRLLHHIIESDLFDDGISLASAVRTESARMGMDPAPVPAEPVSDDGTGRVGLMRFLRSARESDFCADGIRDDVLEEFSRLGLCTSLQRAPDDAILHVPAEKLTWAEGRWFATKDDLLSYLPAGAEAPNDADGVWPPAPPAARAASLRAAGMPRADADRMAERYGEYLWVRWGLRW
jgi:hypothetical protein